jgi:hypothetical protein
LYAQEGVRKGAEAKGPSGKIMVVPFEPKMYRSDIDMKIHQETKWNSSQINEYFRKQLDKQVAAKLRDQGSVITFYDDSTKTAKDLSHIYKTSGISFDKVSNPGNPLASAPKKESAIKNGQLEVEVNSDVKFSNIRFDDGTLLPYLTGKYSSEYFVFINELDILTLPESYDLATDTYQREVTVHYTILDKNSKLLAAGLATSKFSSKENNPKKIVSTCFPSIATFIATRLKLATTPAKAK